MLRKLVALAAVALLACPVAAQTVRFQTSVGAFDMLLNPTGNSDLQGHVDNLLASVAAGVYDGAVVNRAAQDFVLQIGSFQTDSVNVAEIPEFGFESSDALSPVIVDADNDGQVDFSTAGLTNSVGTVSLALSAGNANSGSASFFVNVADNAFLDGQDFIPFAQIADLSTIDRIMNSTIVDLSSQVGQPGSLAYIDVPLAPNGDLIIIEGAAVISQDNQAFIGPLRNKFEFDSPSFVEDSPEPPVSMPGDETDPPIDNPFADLTEAQLNLLFMPEFMDELQMILDGTLTTDEFFAGITTDLSGATGVPEPSAVLLALGGALALARRR